MYKPTKKEQAEFKRVSALRIRTGSHVWLKPFREGKINEPRQKARILGIEGFEAGGNLMVEVEPEDKNDDGLREIPIDQVESRVVKLTTRDFYKALRELGFKRSCAFQGLVSYTKKVGKLVLNVQLFPKEKRGRVSLQLGNSYPTGFSTVDGMKTAIQFEEKRPNSRVSPTRYFNGDNGCKKGLSWTQENRMV